MLKAPSLWLALLLPGVALANDFPTQARVEFVLGCMNEQGGQSYDTLYKCVCLVDAIAAEMSHERVRRKRRYSASCGRRRASAAACSAIPTRRDRSSTKLEAAIERGKARCFIRN